MEDYMEIQKQNDALIESFVFERLKSLDPITLKKYEEDAEYRQNIHKQLSTLFHKEHTMDINGSFIKRKKSGITPTLGKVSTVFAIILKSTKLLKVIQAVKFLKFAKPMVMVFSMLLSILAYSAVWGPAFAIGFIILMFIHEMGHVIAMNKEGFKTNAPVFIPFLGAMLFSPPNMTRKQEAIIGIGGPLVGGFFSLVALGIYFIYPSDYLLALSYVGIFLNLFQMIPLSPLDGGRIIQAVGKNFQFVGILFLMAITFLIRQPSILLIWIIVLFDFNFLTFKQRIIASALVELALIVFTATGIGITDNGVFWVCVFDSVVGFFYVLMIYKSWRRNKDDIEYMFAQSTLRPPLPRRQQIFWLAMFLCLVASLFLTLYFMSPLLQHISSLHQ